MKLNSFLAGQPFLEEQPFTLSKGVERLHRGHMVGLRRFLKWTIWLCLNADHLTQVHAFFNIVHMEPFWWEEVLAILSSNGDIRTGSQPQRTPFKFKSFHNKSWDPRWGVCTGAFPILWVARCQVAQTEVDQENQQTKNHLMRKNHCSNSCQSRKRAKLEPPGKQNN